MIDYIETNFPVTQIDFVYNPNNKVLTDILKSKNVTFDVPQVKLCLSDFVPYSFGIDVGELKPEHEKQYIDLHETDTYWTSEKVLGAKDRFRVITAVDNGEVVGYLDITKCYRENEIYDLRTKAGYEKYRKDLLAKAIQLNRPNGIMAQLDIDDTDEIALFKEMGFEETENSQSILAVYRVE